MILHVNHLLADDLHVILNLISLLEAGANLKTSSVVNIWGRSLLGLKLGPVIYHCLEKSFCIRSENSYMNSIMNKKENDSNMFSNFLIHQYVYTYIYYML